MTLAAQSTPFIRESGRDLKCVSPPSGEPRLRPAPPRLLTTSIGSDRLRFRKWSSLSPRTQTLKSVCRLTRRPVCQTSLIFRYRFHQAGHSSETCLTRHGRLQRHLRGATRDFRHPDVRFLLCRMTYPRQGCCQTSFRGRRPFADSRGRIRDERGPVL